MIKENHVIGRMGKGYTARIAFDLDVPMGASTCVACGECADDCPTGALTHKRVIETKLAAGSDVTVDDLLKHEIPEIREAFQGVSLAFLRSNIHAVKRRDYRKGEVICREGEYGATAFFIEKGSVDIFLRTPVEHVENQPRSGFWGAIGRFTTKLTARPGDNAREYIPVDAPVALPSGRPQATMSAGDIFGEMTCMSYYPRSATVTAARGLHRPRDAAQRPLHHAAQPVVPPRARGEVPRPHDRRPPAQRSAVRPVASRRGTVPPDRRQPSPAGLALAVRAGPGHLPPGRRRRPTVSTWSGPAS